MSDENDNDNSSDSSSDSGSDYGGDNYGGGGVHGNDHELGSYSGWGGESTWGRNGSINSGSRGVMSLADLRSIETGYADSVRSKEYQDSLAQAFSNAGWSDSTASSLSAYLTNNSYSDRAGRYGIIDGIAGANDWSRYLSQGLSTLIGMSPLGRLMSLGDLALSANNYGLSKNTLSKALGFGTSFINDPALKNMARIGGSVALGDTRGALGTLGSWMGGSIGSEMNPAYGGLIGSYLGSSLLGSLSGIGGKGTIGGTSTDSSSWQTANQTIGKSTSPLDNINWGNLTYTNSAFGGSNSYQTPSTSSSASQGLLSSGGDQTSSSNKDLNSYNLMEGTSYSPL